MISTAVLADSDIVVKVKDYQEFIKDTNDISFTSKFSTPQIVALAGVAITLLISLVTLGLVWYVTASIYLKCKQGLALCKEKIAISDALMEKRKFDEKLFEKLSNTANFDASKNAEEVKEKFDSIYEAQPKL